MSSGEVMLLGSFDDPRGDGSYNALQLDALSSAQATGQLPLALNGVQPFSIDAWIRFNGLPAQATALAQQGVFAFGSQGSSVFFQVAGFPAILSDPGQSVLRDDAWHNICATFDGGTIRLYIDGLFNSGATPQGASTAGPSPLVIGTGVQGLVRRVRVYNTALTSDQVMANMLSAPAAGTVTAAFDFSQVPPVDTGPSALPITLQNNAVMTRVSPALSLGTAGFARPFGDRAVNPGGAQVDPYAVQAWIFVSPSAAVTQAIFVNADLASDTGIALLLQYDPVQSVYRLASQRGGGGPGELLVSTASVQTGSWVNVATTFDGQTLSLYLNGALDSSIGCLPIPLYRSQSDLLIGSGLASGIPAPGTTFQGFIREIDVWSISLTAAQVTQYMGAYPDPTTAGLAAAYSFTSSPARNQANGHPIGLAEGAVLSGQLGPASNSDVEPAPAEGDEALLTQLRAAVDLGDIVQANAEGFRLAMEEDVAGFDDPADQALVRARWGEVLTRLRVAPLSLPMLTTLHHIGGERLLVCHTPRGSRIVFRAADTDVDACTLWKVNLVFIIVAGALDAFTGIGVGATASDRAIAYIARILATPAVAAQMARGQQMTAKAVFTILALLQAYGSLRPLIVILAEVGLWTLLRVIARMILVFAGVGAASVVASLVATAATFAVAYSQRPSSCDPLPTVGLASITFDFDPTGVAIDGLPLRKNYNTDIGVPEWVKGKTAATDSLAAYAISAVSGKVPLIQATFNIPAASGSIIKVQATGGGILGAIDPVTVAFTGTSATVQLGMPHHTLAAGGVQAQNIQWIWQYQIDGGAWTTMATTNHRIYVLLSPPALPWMQGADRSNRQLPWTDVLDYACVWANGATTPDQAARLVTTKVNSGVNLTYDMSGGASKYTGNTAPQTFLCTAFLNFLATGLGNGRTVNCTDCATIVTAFANAVGANLFASTMFTGTAPTPTTPPALTPFKCNEIIAIGQTSWANPFPPGNQFNYHEVAWTGAGSFLDPLYDACLQADMSSNPWSNAGPKTAGLPLAFPFTTQGISPTLPIATPFADVSYRERLAQNIAAGIAACVPRGAWWYASGGRRPVL